MTIVRLAVLWSLGIWIANRTTWSLLMWTTGVGVCAIILVVLRQYPRSRLVMACFAAFCSGGARATSALPHLNAGHVEFYSNNPEIALIGSVADEPLVHDRRVELIVRSESIRLPGQPARPVEGLVLVQVPRFPVIPYGTRLQISGRLEEPPTGVSFDYRAYLAQRGIYRIMQYPALEVLAHDQGHSLYEWLYALKARARSSIYRQIPDPQASLLSGVLLGDDSGLPPDLEDDFRTTGMSHIIAISGFNIALLAGVLLRSSRMLLGPRASAWVALAGIALYTILVGADASVVRAALMASLYIIATRFLGRPTFAPAALFTAAFFMSLANPRILDNVGFQLSFAATLGLMLYAEPFSRWTRARLERWFEQKWLLRVMPLLSETVLVTFAAQLLTLPLVAYHFGQVSFASLPANLLILPVQSGVMLWGGLAAITGVIVPPLGQLFAWVAWLFLAYTTTMVQALAHLPFAALHIDIGLLGVVAFYLLIFGATWFRRTRPERRQQIFHDVWQRAPQGALGLCFIFVTLSWQWHRTQPDGLLHVAFFDVGQGDAIFIQTPEGQQFLVDGGHYPTVLNTELGRQMPFWDRHLDVVVATHPDEDHIAGLPGVFERYRVDMLITNGAKETGSDAYELLLAEAEADGVMIYTAHAGERLTTADGVEFEFLHPGTVRLESDNDNSVAFRLLYGDFSLLLTGDAEQEAERSILESHYPVQALVFKAGHHGSRTSSNDFFLDAVRPQIVVVSAGADNRFGHPHAEMLQRASEIGATVLRTDELGTIEVITDGKQMWWEALNK